MRKPITEEIQKWFDKHQDCVVNVTLPNGYGDAIAVYDVHNADIPVFGFGHYAITFTNGEMELWAADNIKHLEEQLKNQKLNH